MSVHNLHKRNVGPLWKPRMPLECCPQGPPIEVEILNKHRALRITNVEDDALAPWD